MSGKVMRHLDIDSPVHSLWAGTKILWVPIVGTSIAFQLSWTTVGIGWAAALVVIGLSRLPRGVTPRPPKLLWIGLGISFFFALLSNDDPMVLGFGIGGVLDLGQFIAFAWLMTAMALLIGWTTRLDDIAAALNRLLRPLGRVGLPIKEIGTVLVVAVRTVPLLIEEVRVIVAARKLRPKTDEQPYLDAGADIAVALVVSTFRRAGEMARTLAARGGIRTPPPDRQRPGVKDLVATVLGLTVVALVIVAG